MSEEKLNNRRTGENYESIACEYLISKGLHVIERNFRCRIGEIDIILKDGDTYVFTEVKYRKTAKYGSPYEAVTKSKMKKISQVSLNYIKYKKLPINGSFRFDVISILDGDITWYKDAFPFIK
ncbi:MAG: YraN family protein [Lachnospiraceae bacterium]|nr:YraN family protein [Lachnospiraceae bacterium]